MQQVLSLLKMLITDAEDKEYIIAEVFRIMKNAAPEEFKNEMKIIYRRSSLDDMGLYIGILKLQEERELIEKINDHIQSLQKHSQEIKESEKFRNYSKTAHQKDVNKFYNGKITFQINLIRSVLVELEKDCSNFVEKYHDK